MRIACLSTMSGFYGGEVHLTQLAQGLQDRGHHVVSLVRPHSQLALRLRDLGLEAIPLAPHDWYDPVSMSRLGRWLRGQGIQILHTHLPRDYYIGATVTLGTDIRNVGTRHLLRPISKPVFKRPFLRRFHAMIAVSDAVRRGLAATDVLDPDRVEVVHNGIPLRPPDPARWARWRLARGLRTADPVIGYVGMLAPEKGLDTLLTAVAALAPHHPRLKVVLLGDDRGRPGYAALLAQRAQALGLAGYVDFLGYVPEAAGLSGAFDVQVICSQAEPFGLVTLEAMAAGRPVVATDSGGSPEIVRDGVEGFLVPPQDARRLAVHLETLLHSPGLRREMGARGRARVATDFSLAAMVTGTENVYRKVLAAARPTTERATA